MRCSLLGVLCFSIAVSAISDAGTHYAHSLTPDYDWGYGIHAGARNHLDGVTVHAVGC